MFFKFYFYDGLFVFVFYNKKELLKVNSKLVEGNFGIRLLVGSVPKFAKCAFWKGYIIKASKDEDVNVLQTPDIIH